MANVKDAEVDASNQANATGKKSGEMSSLFWTLLLILFARAFIAEPYKIPSGSMIPTLLIGDHILVSKSAYDLRVPFTNIQFAKVSEPKRGDVIVFTYPNYEDDPTYRDTFFIKRLIGLPGDKISIVRGEISINGEAVVKTLVDSKESGLPGYLATTEKAPNYSFNSRSVDIYQERLPGSRESHILQHYTFELEQLDDAVKMWKVLYQAECMEVGKAILNRDASDSRMMNQICEFTVPDDHYFGMGDNRDGSSDSRAWGFIPRSLLKGKALFIWLPWKSRAMPDDWDYTLSGEGLDGGPMLRWKRFGLRII
ncbi:signal peptidase I [bacterium]|nr:signal peptidase I [bacterium]